MTEALASLILATLMLMGSPGPATLGLAATGANVGFRRGLPFLLGVMTGLAIVISGAALGLATLFENFPQLRLTIQTFGTIYICYLAYKIAMAPILSEDEQAAAGNPVYLDGLLLNLLNAKAYAVFLAVFSQFLLPGSNAFWSYMLTGLVCFGMGMTVNTSWLWFGSAISPLFRQPRSARILRIVFAVLMVASVVLVIVS
ncbi:MAG: LysE family translocator [Gammaproteobacteria bacterium]